MALVKYWAVQNNIKVLWHGSPKFIAESFLDIIDVNSYILLLPEKPNYQKYRLQVMKSINHGYSYKITLTFKNLDSS